MLSKKTKKNIFYAVEISIVLLFILYIIFMKTPALAPGKEYFTSVSSGIYSDPTNIWAVGNASNGSFLTKMTFEGSNLNLITNFSLPIQSNVQQILSFGTDVWASDTNKNIVYVIDPGNGNITQTINVGQKPLGMAFDGVNVWVCNYSSGTCTVINEGSGSIVSTITLGAGPMCALFDGQYVWVSTYYGQVFIIDPSKMSLKNQFSQTGTISRMTCLNGSVYGLQTPDRQFFYVLQMSPDGVQNTFNIQKIAQGGDIYEDISNDGKNILLLSIGGNVLSMTPDGTYINDISTGLFGSSFNFLNDKLYVLDSRDNNVAVYKNNGGSLFSSVVPQKSTLLQA